MSLRETVQAPLLLLVIASTTVLLGVPLVAAGVVKMTLPFAAARRVCNAVAIALAERWIDVNSGLIDRFTDTQIDIRGMEGLRPDGHYLVVANHQSWVDIPILQKMANRRIPFLRFFLKSQLIWVPMLGLVWWALDFPFMKRYSRSQIERNPALAGRDIAETRRACEKFRHTPVSVMNFVEGTRRTAHKHANQDSPFQHLLKPRAGGIAFVLGAMGDVLDAVVEVSIVYDGPTPSMLDLLAGRVRRVLVQVQTHPVPDLSDASSYESDPEAAQRFRDWINALWAAKDQELDRLKASLKTRE